MSGMTASKAFLPKKVTEYHIDNNMCVLQSKYAALKIVKSVEEKELVAEDL